MARKPHTPETPEVEPGDVPGNAITLSEEASIRNDDAERAFDAARALGQIEAARFSAQCAEKVMVEVFIKLKENKAYRAVMITDDSGNRRRCADLEEFCEHHLGSSYSKLKELTANYNLLGADLFEQAERLGFRRNDYRALKALPAEDQDVIKQAMQPESGRDQIIDLLQEMAARHASEKAALTAQAQEATDTAEARGEVIATKERVINTLQEETHKLRRRLETATPDEIGADLRQETAGIGWSVVGRINTDLAEAFKALDEHAQANDCTHGDFMSGVLLEIDAAVLAIRERYAVKARPDGDERPEWVKDQRPAEEILGDEWKQKVADFNARMAAGK